jgi:hypothetical protein
MRRFNPILLAVGVLLAGVYLWILCALVSWAPLNPDAGYYLSVARDVARGIRLYDQLKVPYTPIGLSILSFTEYIFPGDYSRALATVLLFELLSAAGIFLILRRLLVPAGLSLLASAASGFSILNSQGVFIELEPFCLFFSLAALYSVLAPRPPILVSGGFAALALLSKQYGLGAIAAPLTAIFLSEFYWTVKLKRIALFFIGWLLPILLVSSYFFVSYGMSLRELISNFKRPGFGVSYQEASHVGDWAIENLLSFLIVLSYGMYSRAREKNYWILLAAALMYLPSLAVRQSWHYFILVTPFVSILTAYSVSKLKNHVSLPIFCGLNLVFAASVIVTAKISLTGASSFEKGAKEPSVVNNMRLRGAYVQQSPKDLVPCSLLIQSIFIF